MNMAKQFLDMNPELREEGWSANRVGDFNCPCGRHVEQDGECPNGHTSPMRTMGMI